MGLNTKINYVTATHNFWMGGCDKISEGCKNCFAERLYKRFYGKDFSKPIKSKNFDAPLKWKKPQVILVNDMSDFFHKDVNYDWQVDAFRTMAGLRRHRFLLLTKRPINMANFILKGIDNFKKLPIGLFTNIWLGVSVENQRTADERIPELLKIPRFKKWLSVEPLIGEIDIQKHLIYGGDEGTNSPAIDWLVAGAETGIGARYMNPQYPAILLKQCKSASVPFFMKQMSNKEPIPKDLMVRQYPKEIEGVR